MSSGGGSSSSKRSIEDVLVSFQFLNFTYYFSFQNSEDERREEVKRSRTGIAETMDTEAEIPPCPPEEETLAPRLEQATDANASTAELTPVPPVAESAEPEEEEADEECPQRMSFEAIYAGRFKETVENIVLMSPPPEEAPQEDGLPVYGPQPAPLDYSLGSDLPELPDIDSHYKDFPECCTGVSRLIYERRKESEEVYRVKDTDLESADGFSPNRRMLAANMIYHRLTPFKENRETFHMALLILDRYLTCGKVPSAKYDRISILAAIATAWSYVEVPLGDIRSFGGVHDDEDPVEHQLMMFEALNFDLGIATLPYFIQRFLLTVELEGHETAEELAMFLGDLAAAKYEMLKYSPSLIAATAVYMAHCIYNEKTDYLDTLAAHSGYTFEQVKECADQLVDLFIETREAVAHKDPRDKQRVPIEIVIRQPVDVKTGMDRLDDVARGSLGIKFGQFMTVESSTHDSSSEDESNDGSIYIEGSLSVFKTLGSPEDKSQHKDGSNNKPGSGASPTHDLDAGPSSQNDVRDDSNGGSGSEEGSAFEDEP
eukprot:g1698.t1